jgi:hypothetical protein
MKIFLLLLFFYFGFAHAETCTPIRDAKGRIERSQSQVRQFKRANPCPATGFPYGPCKGYVVDHIVPLCACGDDRPSNMQWQTLSESKKKDVEERKLCRKLRQEHGGD